MGFGVGCAVGLMWWRNSTDATLDESSTGYSGWKERLPTAAFLLFLPSSLPARRPTSRSSFSSGAAESSLSLSSASSSSELLEESDAAADDLLLLLAGLPSASLAHFGRGFSARYWRRSLCAYSAPVTTSSLSAIRSLRSCDTPASDTVNRSSSLSSQAGAAADAAASFSVFFDCVLCWPGALGAASTKKRSASSTPSRLGSSALGIVAEEVLAEARFASEDQALELLLLGVLLCDGSFCEVEDVDFLVGLIVGEIDLLRNGGIVGKILKLLLVGHG
ncbi:hypothetical protein BN1708_009148 [Verticillium longisporum]|uniref:Uncharacterized protein n=1 Tax=Verticillium longisporum TaxID=100787 RepID=A0A0G4KDL1_VERLO|nr:hypothetical protein BN1708_009148 [Verticillium longisporum]